MNKYNETEKVLLLKAYIESGMSYCSFARSHNIPVNSFSFMLQEYGHPDVSSLLELMKKVNLPTTVESLQAQLSKERKEHEAELKRLKKELDKEKLRSLANSTMIDLAEKMFNISIRKKIRCQVISTLSQGKAAEDPITSVSFLCDYFGITRQGYYKHVERSSEVNVLQTSIVLYAMIFFIYNLSYNLSIII